MKAGKLRIGVLTDFHAFAGRPGDGGASPSWLDLAKVQSDPGQNPFAALIQTVEKEKLRADLLLCCGDLGDKADPAGQQYVWGEVEKVREALEAKLTLGAAGNHDVDSRYIHSAFDAKGYIQTLSPGFPVNDERCWLEYWARNFTCVEEDGVRFVLLNTAAYHGTAKDGAPPEYVHGRVSDHTISRMVAELAKGGERTANVLVCHHHPYKNDKITAPDYSHMENGDKLVNEIVAADVGPWLIIHGHKHEGRVFYAQGGNAYPTVFAAASFAAKAYPNQVGHTYNEFYILELEVPDRMGEVTSLLGSIDTWTWSYGANWRRPQVGEGVGPRAGFGARVDVGQLAKQIAEWLRQSHAGRPTPWQQVEQAHAQVRHLIPEELEKLISNLRKYHGAGVTRDNERREVAEVQVS